METLLTEPVDTCKVATLLGTFLQKEKLNSSFEEFYESINTKFTSRETLLFSLALFHQRLEIRHENIQSVLLEKQRDLNEFMLEFRLNLKKIKNFKNVENSMFKLKKNKEFWKFNWNNWSLRKRNNKDVFKIFLPKLIDEISREFGEDKTLNGFLNERDLGKVIFNH
jgi:hypothetical protein